MRPTDEVLFGDIYREIPSIHVQQRPFQVVRPLSAWPGDETIREARIHTEGGTPPKNGFKWTLEAGGDSIISTGIIGFAILLSDDCEIENDEKHRTVALIKPWSNLPVASQERVSTGDHNCFFELPAQTEEPRIDHSYVDFRRLTTVRPGLLGKEFHYAAASNELRRALAVAFWEYLMRHAAETDQ